MLDEDDPGFDIGEQNPIEIPDQVGYGQGRDPERQATEELLTPIAAQDPTLSMSAPKQEQVGQAPTPEMPPTRGPSPDMAMGARSTTPVAPPEKSGGGFDWSRAFFAAGGGDLGAFDADRRDRRDAPARAQKAEQERQLGQEKLNAFSLQKQKARDAIDPGSNNSLAAQREFAELMSGRAKQLAEKHPALAAEFEAYAKKAPSMHAAAIDRAMKSPRMAEVLRQIDSESRNDLAGANLRVKREALRATVADRNSDNTRQREQLNEAIRHNQAVEAATGNRLTAKIEKDQEKLNEKVAGLNEQDDLLTLAGEQRKKTNTGFFNNKLQQGLKYLGLESKDFDNLESTLAGVTNQIIKLQAGGNVTAGEAARMRQQLPSVDMDEQEFGTKLEAVARQIRLKKENAAKQYERKAGGDVRDQAPIGHELVDKQARPKASKPPAPPPGTQPGLVRRNKNTGAQWKWDGADWQAL